MPRYRQCASHPEEMIEIGDKCEKCIAYRKREFKEYKQINPGENRDVYESVRWRKASKIFRLRNPLCIHCNADGIIKAATVVDHIVPIRDGGDVWASSNWQPLCLRCHGKKTIKETQGRLQK